MKKFLKKLLLIIVCCLFFSLSCNYSTRAFADVQIPESVRIGIYFKDTVTHNVNTAVSCFTVSAEKGLQIGFIKDGKFTVLDEEAASSAINIRKDAYYIKSGTDLKEYNPSDNTVKGEKIGPYHVKIGSNLSSLKAALDKLTEIKKKGISAYPVYADSWQIWTGFYTDEASARTNIENDICKKLGDNNLTIVKPAENRIVAVSARGETIALFGSDKSSFQIRPRKENNPYVFKINDLSYRGDIEVRRYCDSDMTVINILPLEQYLYGVVPYEIEASSHPEALKAQAVVARTYTLNNINKHENLGFDLCNTTWCQVYKGFAGENPATNNAVDDTAGKNVIYDGKLAQVFYFSSSGGRTEDVQYVWGSEIPYLKSVEDKYESGKSWKYNWESVLKASEIKEIMLSRKYDLGDINDIKIEEVSPSGRVTKLVIKGTKDERIYTKGSCRYVLSELYSQWYIVSTDADITAAGTEQKNTKIRLGDRKVMTAKGLKTVKSLKSNVKVIGANGVKKAVPAVPTEYRFTGKGWGHGVGMSQEGAKGMAKAGFKYEQILTHYFQGTKVE